MGSLPNLHELTTRNIKVNFGNDLYLNVRYRERAKNEEKAGIGSRKNSDARKLILQPRLSGFNPNELKLPRKISSTDKTVNPRINRNFRSSSLTANHFYSVNPNGPLARRQIGRQPSVTNDSTDTGASSVQKLISVVRNTPSQYGPVYNKQGLQQQIALLCLLHGLFTLSYMPIVILQSSISSWWMSSSQDLRYTSHAGSMLLSILYIVAAVSSILAPLISYKIGHTKNLFISYFTSTIFIASHLYPTLYLLIPVYILMGVCVANINYSRIAYMCILAAKLKLVINENEDVEMRFKVVNATKEALMIKLCGLMSLAENVGLVLGGIVTYFLIQATNANNANGTGSNNVSADNSTLIEPLLKNFKNDIFEQVCGFKSCPNPHPVLSPLKIFVLLIPNKNYLTFPCKTSTMLVAVFVGCCIVDTVISYSFIHRVKIRHHYTQQLRQKLKNMSKTIFETLRHKHLRFVVPLMLFIGIEQGFMFADFTKLYVVCVIGVQSTPLIFISLGLLQSIAAITFSLLVNHIKRFYIIVGGIAFQACLLLVLIIWKPTSDDPALFYVISSAWGVCNAIWDTISFCLVVSIFPDCWQFPLSQNYLFRYLGLSVAFFCHELMCTSIKLYIICFMLLISVIPYTLLEMQLHSKEKEKLRRCSIKK